jgi:hypothetical protein
VPCWLPAVLPRGLDFEVRVFGFGPFSGGCGLSHCIEGAYRSTTLHGPAVQKREKR